MVAMGNPPDVLFDKSFVLSKIEEYGDVTGDVGDEMQSCLSSWFFWRFDCCRKNLFVAAAMAAAAAAAAFSALIHGPIDK